MDKQFLFIRFDESEYDFKESDNLDDFVNFNHYLDYDDTWEKDKSNFKASGSPLWLYDGNDVYYSILTHPCWNKLWVAEIITLDDEGNEIKFLDKEHCSNYLDEVINSVYNQNWFWAHIYKVEKDNDFSNLIYAYDIDDDGNVYNFDEHYNYIMKEINNVNT